MFSSDFVWLNFDETFGPGEAATRTFVIDEQPVTASADPEGCPQPESEVRAVGYILIQARDVGIDADKDDDGDATTHEVTINGNQLPSFDMVNRTGWNLWMDRVPPEFLQVGDNRLTVRRVAGDRFHVANIVVHWREERVAA